MNQDLWKCHRWTATKGKLADVVWQELGTNRSKREIRRAIERGQVSVNGLPQLRASHACSAGDRIEVRMSFFEREIEMAGFSPDHVLYEDEYLIVYDKPPFVACDDEGLLPIVRTAYPEAELCHRLDADTSGVILLARKAQHLEVLKKLFRERKIGKTYICLVDGVPKEKSGRVENYLGKLPDHLGQAVWGEVSEARGRFALTDWELKKCGEKAAWVVCRPMTGRTHQIRLHMAGMGHPIIGDYRYGRRFRCGLYPHRHLLHARRLEFTHPFTGQHMSVVSEVPSLFSEIAALLKLRRA